jgi:DNA-binding transcriptional ArsR family regulator
MDNDRRSSDDKPTAQGGRSGEAALNPNQIAQHAAIAKRGSDYLKTLAHPARLTILTHLSVKELSVAEIEQLIGARQASVSQHLARLRSMDVVGSRRDGKAIYYTLADERARQLVAAVHEWFGDAATTVDEQ